MKKLYILFSTIFICSITTAQNPIPNPGFETWSGNPLNADGWYSNGTASNILVTQVPGYAGSFAAQGNVIHFNGGQLVAPYLGCNFPVTQRYNSMQFYYKANLDSGDVFQVSAAIYDTGNALLAANYFNIAFSSSTFTLFTLNIDSVNSGIPDHALITFTIIPMTPNPNPHINSYFVIDDVEFISATTGIKENIGPADISIFPNPVNEKLFIFVELKEKNPLNLFLYDATGKIVLQKQSAAPVNGKFADVLKIESISSGIYMLMLSGEKGSYLRKVVVE